MDKKILVKVNMFTQVDEVLRAHPAILEASPAMNTMSVHLREQLAAIEREMQPLLLDKTGYAQDKKAAKENLVRLLVRVCGAIKSYGMARPDFSLYQQANYGPSHLKKMRDTELQEAAGALYTLALEHAADILPYNVNAGVLADLNAAITQFREDNPQPRTVLINTKSLRHLLYQKVGKLNEYLRLQMDPMAETFQFSHPEFYELYRNARRNYSEGIRHRQPEPESLATTAPSPSESAAAFDRAVQELQEEVASNGVPVQE